MNLRVPLITALVIGFFSFAGNAAPVDLAGVKLPETTEVAGSKLVLNGAGVRYKSIFKVTVIALYLGKKASSAEEVYSASGPKRVSITLLRDVDGAEIGKTFSRGLGDNASKGQMSQLVPGLIKLGDLLSGQKRFLAGESLSIDWVPGVGTTLTSKGRTLDVVFKEPEFFNGIVSIWLGPTPADWRLKDALLGTPSS
jgi:hypothetical protein